MSKVRLPEGRIAVLDGLRGVAILVVLLFHFVNNPLVGRNHITIISVIVKVTEYGWAGVDLFFVLSGFLIGSILLNNRGKETYFKVFYIRRFFRIVPTYYIVLLLFFCAKYFFDNPDAYIFQNSISLWYYFLFIQNIIMGWVGSFGSEGIGPTWSLAIEEQFYLICPLLIYLVQPKKLIYWLLLFIVAAPIFRYYSSNWYMGYVGFTSRMDSLAIGVATALYIFGVKNNWYKALNKNSVLLLMGITVIIMAGCEFIVGNMGVLNHTFIAAFCSFMLLYTLQVQNLFTKTLSGNVLQWLGAISYPLYLVHNFINGFLHLVILKNLIPVYNTVNDVLLTLLALIISVLLSLFIYKYVDQVFIRKGKEYKY